MNNLKQFANSLIREQVENYKQLALFDDAFSSRTIVSKLLKHYKSHKLVDESAKIKTAHEAYLASTSKDVLKQAAKSAVDNSGDNGAFDFVRIDVDIIRSHIPTEPKELHAFMSKMAENNNLTDDESYDELLTDYEPKELEEFTNILNNETDVWIDVDDVTLALANHIEYIDQHSYESLVELFGYDVATNMFQEQIRLYPKSIDMREFKQLANTLKDYGNAKTIKIYRAITLPFKLSNLEKALGENEGVGIFWSYVESGAIAHNGGSQGFTLVLKAEVDVRNVDWDATFYKSLYDLREELEIELKSGYTVDVVGYSLDCPDTDRLVRSLTHYYYGDLELNDEQLQTLTDNLGAMNQAKVSPAIVVKA